MRLACFVIFLLLISSANAFVIGYLANSTIDGSTPSFGVDWSSAPIKFSWDSRSTGFCKLDSQCLVSNLYNESFNNNPEAFFDIDLDARPKCISSDQFILDHYCIEGIWSSRTRFLAEHLLATAAIQSPEHYEIYCSSYDDVLNFVDYSVKGSLVTNSIRDFCDKNSNLVACANNFCILQYPGNVIVGTTSNTDIDSENSMLLAFNLSKDVCNSVTGQTFSKCSNSDVFYNPSFDAIIYSNVSIPSPNAKARSFFDALQNDLINYTYSYVNDPNICSRNYEFLKYNPYFDNIFVARNESIFIYSIKQEDLGDQHVNYALWHLFNVDESCTKFKRSGWDPRVNCEVQPFSDEFYLVSFNGPSCWGSTSKSVVDEWNDMVSFYRVVE